jgi:hypothetical protein
MATTQINIAGSGFYPGGSASVTITTNLGSMSTFTTNATATGAISMVILIANISGIATAGVTSISMYSTDITTGDQSNTVSIPIGTTEVAPVLVAPSGSITLTNVPAQDTGISISYGYSGTNGYILVHGNINTGDQIQWQVLNPSGGVIASGTNTAAPFSQAGTDYGPSIIEYWSSDGSSSSTWTVTAIDLTKNTYNGN